MNSPDILINSLGIAYGLVLIAGVFVRSQFTEAMRIDALFIRTASEQTRPINLVFGLLIAGYGVYSLLFR